MTTVHRAPRGALRTPYLLLDPAEAVRDLRDLSAALPGAAVHYPVAANAHPRLLRALAVAGAGFAVTDAEQAVACLAAGAPPEALLHARTVTRRDDLSVEAALGVDLFTVDSPAEAWKLAEAAPGAQVLCRLGGSGDSGPRGGCTAAEAVATLRLAAALGLRPVGVGVDAGTRRPDPRAWRAPLRQAARVFARLAEEGLELDLVDVGGGFPAWLAGRPRPPAEYGREIGRAVGAAFGRRRPRLAARPGRGVAGDAGTTVTSVVGVTWRGDVRRVTVDASLPAAPDPGTEAPVDAPRRGQAGPCLVLGTSADAPPLPVDLPLDLEEGDLLLLRCTGAYGDPRVPVELVEPLAEPLSAARRPRLRT